MLITTGGVLIRTGVEEIRETGRAAQGVRLINLDEGENSPAWKRWLKPKAKKGEDRRWVMADVAGETAGDEGAGVNMELPLPVGKSGVV